MRQILFAIAALATLIVTPVRADDYDNALDCLILIEIAKQDYTGENVDALREAGNRMVEWTDSSRPADLTDQQKLDRYTTALSRVIDSGGLGNEENRQQAISCAGYFDIELTLPQP